MPSQYGFLRTHGGITYFARVAVESQLSSTWTVTWNKMIYNDSSHPYNGYYDTALETGVAVAVREHEQRGGVPQQVEIVELLANPVDTPAHAVRCATALATWKALGHSESDMYVVFEEEEWRIKFLTSDEICINERPT